MVWKFCMLVVSLYIGAPSFCRAVGRELADYHQEAEFHFACSSEPNVSSISLYTKEPVEQLQETFSNFVENDDVKAVIFWLDFQKYEGLNPMLYNLTTFYGLWTWTWVYDEYGKTLLRFSIQAEYLSFGLLHRNVKTMHIKFDNRTDVSDIAHLPESCKAELGVIVLADIINVQDKQGKDEDNCVCFRSVELSFYRIYHVCCCDLQLQLFENTSMTDCNIEAMQDTKWITWSKRILCIFVVIMEYLVWSSLHWRLLFLKGHTVLAKFKTQSRTHNEFEIDQIELIDCSEKSKVSIIELLTYMKKEQDCTERTCSESLKNDRRSRRNVVWRLFRTLVVSMVLIPIGLWIPVFVSLMYPESRKEEMYAWEEFNHDDINEYNDMVFSNDGTNFSKVWAVFAIVILIFIARICFDNIWYDHSLQCIAHSFPCQSSGEETEGNTEPMVSSSNNESDSQTEENKTPEANGNRVRSFCNYNDDVHDIYKRFLSSKDEINYGHVYDNMHSLAAKLHIKVFRKGIITSYKKFCRIPLKFCLLALPLLVLSLVFYLVLPIIVIYNLFRQVSNKGETIKKLWPVGYIIAAALYLQVVCITVSFINLSLFVSFLLTGFVLNIEYMAQPAIFFVTLFIYIFTEYKNITEHYQDLKIATYDICNKEDKSSHRADFVSHRNSDKKCGKNKTSKKHTLVKSVQYTSLSTVEDADNGMHGDLNGNKNGNKILIFRNVPFVESLRWQDCISRDLFSHICKNISSISNKLVSIMLRLIAVTLFLLVVFCVVKSFGHNPLKSSVLAFTMGIIPVWKQYRNTEKGNHFEKNQKARDIESAVKDYLELSDPDENNKETGQSEGCCTCFISLSESKTSHNSDENGTGQNENMPLLT